MELVVAMLFNASYLSLCMKLGVYIGEGSVLTFVYSRSRRACLTMTPTRLGMATARSIMRNRQTSRIRNT